MRVRARTETERNLRRNRESLVYGIQEKDDVNQLETEPGFPDTPCSFPDR